MGWPAVMSAKVIWDIAFYWGFLGFFYSNDRFVHVADDPALVPHLEGLIGLSNRMQEFFREWAAVESAFPSAQFVDLYSPLNFMVKLHTEMMGKAAEFSSKFDANIRLLRRLAGQLFETVLADKCETFSDDHIMRQVQAWQQDSLLRELRSVHRREQETSAISQGWILSGAGALGCGQAQKEAMLTEGFGSEDAVYDAETTRFYLKGHDSLLRHEDQHAH
jgi:hypothetical protein